VVYVQRRTVCIPTHVTKTMHRYIHAVFTTENGERDDVEFLFSAPSVDATVNIRAASRTINYQDGGRNRNRLEKLRMSLTWQQVRGCLWLPSRALQVKYLLDFCSIGCFQVVSFLWRDVFSIGGMQSSSIHTSC
jgi:hypothetical protein